MFKEFLDILNSISPLSPESKRVLQKHLSFRTLSKGDYLLNHGETCRHIYFVNKGFLRIFYYKNGKNITEWFAREKNFCFSITSYFNKTPSDLIIESIEDSEVIFLSRKGLEELRKCNLEVANLIIEFLSHSLIASQKRMESIQFETAKKRYQNLLKEQPEIIHQVSLHNIATFLGITQETLSRIRAQI
ncbi:Crp/Fnr family transcriptional regulator [Salinimicrobium marinum]|uniref:Crp/Fnr family transcriptional regulator n=1 Tax=Salinimicrobium marinum TaxID=680283 RepID=UPI00167A0423|nr:Crp/Fnr family transcriptional regulator [Salinimicrobium marinum]